MKKISEVSIPNEPSIKRVGPSLFFIGKRYNSRDVKSKKPARKQAFAVRTGLEPATLGVTGRYSNQLNYHTIRLCWGCKYNPLIVTAKLDLGEFLIKSLKLSMLSRLRPKKLIGSQLKNLSMARI